MASAAKLVSVEYEVFGKVQGVFFRKFTHQTATSYGLVGWVKNTERDTVVGVMQGPENSVRNMKDWLQTTGSPKSRIDRCQYKNEKDISKYDFSNFEIDRSRTKKKGKTKKP